MARLPAHTRMTRVRSCHAGLPAAGAGQDPGKPNRHTFGGLTDAAFRLIPLLEAGRAGAWPWEQQ